MSIKRERNNVKVLKMFLLLFVIYNCIKRTVEIIFNEECKVNKEEESEKLTFDHSTLFLNFYLCIPA